MSLAICPQEAAVAKAAGSQQWDEALLAHASQCPVCGEVMRTAQWMRALARDADENHDLPDPALLWQRARWAEMLSRRQIEVERKRRVMEWAELMPLAVVAFGLIVWGIWNAQAVESASLSLLAWLSPQTWLSVYHAASANPAVLWAGVAVLASAVLFFATGILVED